MNEAQRILYLVFSIASAVCEEEMLELGPKFIQDFLLGGGFFLTKHVNVYAPYNTCCTFLTLRPRISLHIASYYQQHEQQHSNTQRQDTFQYGTRSGEGPR